MNILQVTLGFPPAYGWGGPVRNVYRIGKKLAARGHDVTVYCTNLLDKKNKIQRGTFIREYDGMRVIYFNTFNIPFWPGTLGPIWLPELPRYLNKELQNYDVIHLNGYRSFFIAQIARAAERVGVPYVVQPRGTLPVIINNFSLKKAYDIVFGSLELEGLSALIALQDEERQQALAKGVPDSRIYIIPNGLDLEEQTQSSKLGDFRERYNIPFDKILILFVGRINKKKGVDMLVEAFARLDGMEAFLAIVGADDGHLAEVQRIIQKHNLSNRIICPGLLTGEDVYSAYRDSDLFVLPCRADTFPSVIMEACAANLPMVITDRCEMAYLVKDRIADVVPFDVELFSRAMKELLLGEERYLLYKSNCNQVLQDTFSLDVTVDKLERLFKEVIINKSLLTDII